MPTIGNIENNTRKWKYVWLQHVEQRFLQFLIQTKYFNIPTSLGFPLTVIESFQSLLWEGLWCSGCPKSITNNSEGEHRQMAGRLKWKFHFTASWWRIKTSASSQIAGILQKLSLPQELTENFLPFSGFRCKVYCPYKLSAWVYRPALMASGPNWIFFQTH